MIATSNESEQIELTQQDHGRKSIGFLYTRQSDHT